MTATRGSRGAFRSRGTGSDAGLVMRGRLNHSAAYTVRSPAVSSSAAAPLSPPRRRLAGCVLASASLLFALALGELALRLARPQEVMTIAPAGLYAADPPGRYRLRPGYEGVLTNHVEFRTPLRIDALGTRGAERAAKPGELRVLALGDSFTFGVGAEEGESWPARLEASLAASGAPARVWNAGAPGYGVPDEVGWYERHGAPIDPQVIVVAP